MSTASRMSVPTIPTLVSRIAELARDKKSLQVRCATLEAAALNLLGADERVSYHVVEGVLHACSSTGAVRQYVTRHYTNETETIYRDEWVDVAPVPTSPAARIAAALAEPPREMAVLEGV